MALSASRPPAWSRAWNIFRTVLAIAVIVVICVGRSQGRYLAEYVEVFRRSPQSPVEYVRVSYGYESSQSLLSNLLPGKRV